MDDLEKISRRVFLGKAIAVAGGIALGSLPFFGGTTKESLSSTNSLSAKAAGEWDPKTGDGWQKDKLPAVQQTLNEAVKAVKTFFGRSYFLNGTVPVFHLGQAEATVFKNGVGRGSLAAFSTAETLFSKGFLDKNNINPLGFAIAIATDELSPDPLKILSGHEIAHACFNPVKIPPFDTHKVINLAIYSDYLRKETSDNLENKFKFIVPSGLELYCWQLYRAATGKEFYRELVPNLQERNGSKSLEFTEKQVVEATEEMFKRAKMTTFTDLRKLFPPPPR